MWCLAHRLDYSSADELTATNSFTRVDELSTDDILVEELSEKH